MSSSGDSYPMESPPAMAVTDAVLSASRLLVAVSARSIAAIDESITIPQFRMLVVLHALGPMKPSAIAEILHVNPSNATRMVDRLISVDMIERHVNPATRREMVLRLTEIGTKTVAEVTRRRQRHITDIVERMPEQHRTFLVETLKAFNAAGGESPLASIPDDWI